jgi:hypothetical protein
VIWIWTELTCTSWLSASTAPTACPDLNSEMRIAIATIPLRIYEYNDHPNNPYLENTLLDIYYITCFCFYISDRNDFTTLGNLPNPRRMIS